MKRRLISFLLCSFLMHLYAFEGIQRHGSTVDGYTCHLLEGKSECAVLLTSNNSKEDFIWYFRNLNEAVNHYEWLKRLNVESPAIEFEEIAGIMLLFNVSDTEAKKILKNTNRDKRIDWRKDAYSTLSEKVVHDGYITYLIKGDEK